MLLICIWAHGISRVEAIYFPKPPLWCRSPALHPGSPALPGQQTLKSTRKSRQLVCGNTTIQNNFRICGLWAQSPDTYWAADLTNWSSVSRKQILFFLPLSVKRELIVDEFICCCWHLNIVIICDQSVHVLFTRGAHISGVNEKHLVVFQQTSCRSHRDIFEKKKEKKTWNVGQAIQTKSVW